MFDYYDDEDFYPQPDPPYIKQLIQDIDSILNDKLIKVFTDFDIEDGYNHIRINAFAKSHGSCFLKTSQTKTQNGTLKLISIITKHPFSNGTIPFQMSHSKIYHKL